MRSFVTALAAVSAFALASPVYAAVCVHSTTAGAGCFLPGDSNFIVSGNPLSGPVSASIGDSGIPTGSFQDIFQFTIPQTGFGSGSLSTSTPLSSLDATFTNISSVVFNDFLGTTLVNSLTASKTTIGLTEFFGLSGVPITPGHTDQIVVTGNIPNANGNGSYGGNVSFVPTSTVPELGTWAMMLVGFGAIGFVMRRRPKAEPRVRFAF